MRKLRPFITATLMIRAYFIILSPRLLFMSRNPLFLVILGVVVLDVVHNERGHGPGLSCDFASSFLGHIWAESAIEHAAVVHCCQRCAAPVKSIGNGNTMVELRSLAMSNKVAR